MIILRRLGVNIVTYGYGWGIAEIAPSVVVYPFPLSVHGVYGSGGADYAEPEPLGAVARALGGGKSGALGSARSTLGSPKATKPMGRERSTLSSGHDRPISRR